MVMQSIRIPSRALDAAIDEWFIHHYAVMQKMGMPVKWDITTLTETQLNNNREAMRKAIIKGLDRWL